MVKRSWVVVGVVVALAGLVSFGCGKKKGSSDKKGAEAKTYPATAEGLKQQLEDIHAAIEAGKDAEAKALVAEWKLPDHGAWFKKTFGDARGAKLDAEYSKLVGLVPQLRGLVAKRYEKGQKQIVIRKIDNPGSMDARGLQAKALRAMKSKVTLWDVSFVKPGDELGYSLWSFVHVGGKFRFIGKMRGLNDKPPTKVERLFDEMRKSRMIKLLKQSKK